VIGRTGFGLVLAAALLATSACAGQLPAGADGDLANQWPAVARPEQWRPVEGVCSTGITGFSPLVTYNPLDCGKEHRYETVAVADFTGAAASRTTPPTDGSPDLVAAWADCAKKTTAHLGGEWYNGSVWIGVTLPSTAAWGGGARWYRCELAALNALSGDEMTRTSSLKGEFAKASPLKYGCYQYSKRLTAIACDKAHNAEFVGVWDAGNVPFSSLPGLRNKIVSKCHSVVAKFVKVPDDGNMRYRTGLIWDYPTAKEWAAGNHIVRCHLWLDKKKLTKSLKGGGSKVLPVS
jgi:hypothetical protein